MDKFKTIDGVIHGQIIEKKSKFIADIFQIQDEKDAQNRIKEIKKKYYDAKHHCFAYISIDEDGKILEKFSDDGEPSGTAGAPMLAILKGKDLCNILVVVTRYFGGILLGTGGLVRAYSDVTNNTLENSKLIQMQKGKVAKIIMSYADVEDVKYYAKINNINIIKEEYLEKVEFLIEISEQNLNKLYKDIDNLSIKLTKIDILEEKYIKTNITASIITGKI